MQIQKMKEFAFIIFISVLVVFPIEIGAQENEYAKLCAECGESTFPKCEISNYTRLENKIDCAESGCTIAKATQAEMDYMCIVDLNSPESTTAVLPVPLALQMVTTTESSMEIIGVVKAEESQPGVKKVDDNNAKQSQHEEAIIEKPNVDNEKTFPERVDYTNPIETEYASQQPEDETNNTTEYNTNEKATVSAIAENVTAGEEEVNQEVETETPNQNNENNVEQGYENITTITIDRKETDSLAPNVDVATKSLNSPDYPADAPNIYDNKDELGIERTTEVLIANDLQHTSDRAVNLEADVIAAPTVNGTEAVMVDDTMPKITGDLLTCYACTSTTYAGCKEEPGKPVNCQKKDNKPNGCYTLYKADTKTTTRSCISELTDEGFNYCQSRAKECIVCYEKNCNNNIISSAGSSNTLGLNLWLAIASLLYLYF